MKTNNLFTRFYVFLVMFLSVIDYALAENITLVKGESLNAVLTTADRDTISALVIGTTNGGTISLSDLQLMNNMPKLKYLDMSGADYAAKEFPNALNANQNLEVVKLPKNIETLARPALSNMPKLRQVYIPAGVINYNYITGNFSGCPAMTDLIVDSKNVAMHNEGKFVISHDHGLLFYPSSATEPNVVIPEGVTWMRASFSIVSNPYIKSITFPSTFANFVDNINYLNDERFLNRNCEAYYVASGNRTYGSMDGILTKYNANIEGFELSLLPPTFQRENLVIDGSRVKGIGGSLFGNKQWLKRVVITDGITTIGGAAFKNCQSLVYVELASTVNSLGNECFASCANLEQIISHRPVAPLLDLYAPANQYGRDNFYNCNNLKIKIGVPEGCLNGYINSWWNKNWTDGVYGNNSKGFEATVFVEYKSVNLVGGTSLQSVAIPGTSVSITASKPTDSTTAFVNWSARPTVSFANSSNPNTIFTMPNTDVTITAVFSGKRNYTIIGGVTPSGSASVGSIVNIIAPSTKDGQDFKCWRVVSGYVELADSNSVETSFIMTDGDVSIEAVYVSTYMITIEGGSAYVNGEPVLNVPAGTKVTVEADPDTGYKFLNWIVDGDNVILADANSSTTTFIMPESEVLIRANYNDETTGINGTASQKETLVDIYTLSGKVIRRGIRLSSVSGSLPAGVYLVKSDGKTKKIIVK